jgi:tetratricopeptide (TPR) repeat protein
MSFALMQAAGADAAQAEQARLQQCVAAIEADADKAYADAMIWTLQGNRPAARQCLALAMIGQGHAADGATRLETLATDEDSGSMEQRAEYLMQAGHAWLQALEPDAAITAFSQSIRIGGPSADLLVDRASAHFLAEDLKAANGDLNAALDLQPGFGPAHQLRAEVRLEEGALDAAMSDVKAALAADPKNIDTLVLRGRVREAIRLKAEPKAP